MKSEDFIQLRLLLGTYVTAPLCIDTISGLTSCPLLFKPDTLQSGRLTCPTRNVIW